MIDHYLHFEDNEVSVLDANGEVIESKKFKTPAKAKEYFDSQMFEYTCDENVRIEFVHYVPEFPPQRLAVTKKNTE